MNDLMHTVQHFSILFNDFEQDPAKRMVAAGIFNANYDFIEFCAVQEGQHLARSNLALQSLQARQKVLACPVPSAMATSCNAEFGLSRIRDITLKLHRAEHT